MKTPAVTQCAKAILILSMLLLAVGDGLAAQSGTRDHRKRHRIFAAQTGPDQVTLAWDEVPGTKEYRIYLPDPNQPGPPAPGSRPTISFSGSGRRAIVTGVARMAAGAYLEALGEGEVLYRGTFNAIARAPLAPPKAPAAVQARETGETEVTLSWNPVPAATAYMISRAVGGSGLHMLCDVCPPSGEFVDTAATPGLEHTYTVAAIFPLGISTRTPSNKLTVGAAQLAAATASAPPAAAWDKPMSSGTPVSGTDANNSNVGASAGTPTTTTGTTTGTTTTGTQAGTGTGTPTGSTPAGMPAASTQTSNNPGAWVPSGVSGASVNVTSPFTPGGTPTAAMPGQSTTTTTQPTTAFPPTPVTTAPTTTSSTATPTTTVHAATPIGTPCKLDYQRADNMWAAFGHPDGSLGTETISLFPGQTKAFITDWKYEKTRNDGSTYYGSHLRIATNSGSGTIQLQIRVAELTLADFRVRDVGIAIAPGSSEQFQADLIEVSCGK